MARILVADDEARVRIALCDILEMEGYEVIEAETGKEALSKIYNEDPDVILLDIRMPDLDGLEITKRLKNDPELQNTPIVIITGLDDLDSRIKALKLGADDFLTKPPHIAELNARVRALVKVKAYNDHMRNYQKELEKEVAERTEQLQNALNDLAHAHGRLQRTSLSTIHCLSRAAEHRDDDTADHIQRMSRYAKLIGVKLGLEDAEVETILYAAPMHDIGKIGIPDSILLKPGKLDTEEFEVMKQHAEFGASILESETEPILEAGRIIALTHHERWDGSGYPNGLAGDEIPLFGRISAIADVFDALSSKRPYKKAFSLEKSFEIIKESAGNHFEPRLVDVFLSRREEIDAIYNEYKSSSRSGERSG